MLANLLVVSPHFDDAVLGAAHLLGSYGPSTVVTVLGGRPSPYPSPPTPWDAACGFGPDEDVVGVRRREDRAALETLGSGGVWLDFLDSQYLGPSVPQRAEQIAPALATRIRAVRPTAVFLPLGLGHPDHVLTHRAGLLARAEMQDAPDGPTWFCYEDEGYKHIPGLMARRLAGLLAAGVWPTPAMLPVDADVARKRTAIECYASQLAPLKSLQSLDERLGANVPEQYWRLCAPPPGWKLDADAER